LTPVPTITVYEIKCIHLRLVFVLVLYALS
jgi:hypothetical protein